VFFKVTFIFVAFLIVMLSGVRRPRESLHAPSEQVRKSIKEFRDWWGNR